HRQRDLMARAGANRTVGGFWRDRWHRLSEDRVRTSGVGRERRRHDHGRARPVGVPLMEAFLASTLAVALAEIGDKTQLLALVLASRFRKPLPIAFGILIATLANHALAAWGGTLAAQFLAGDWLRWIVGL